MEAIQPRSRRPRSCPHQLSPEVRDEILELRDHLCAAGFDAGPQTIATHLAKHLDQAPSPATIWRILKRCGLVTPQPQKRPKSSWIRFEASLPNQMWQGGTDFRLREDRIDNGGTVTLRYLGRLRHIAVGRAYKHRRVRLLVAGADVRVVDAEGVLLRQLTLDPDRDYQPLGTPTVVHDVLRQVSSMS